MFIIHGMKIICYFYANAGSTTKYVSKKKCKEKLKSLSASTSTKEQLLWKKNIHVKVIKLEFQHIESCISHNYLTPAMSKTTNKSLH